MNPNNRTQHYVRDLGRYYRMPATQVSLTVVLSLFIVSVFMTFALRPTIVAIVNLRKTIVESRKTLTLLEGKTANLQRAANQLELIKPSLPYLNAGVTNTSAGYDPLTSQIESLAYTNGVTLQSESAGGTLLYSRIVTPFLPQKGQAVAKLPISIRVTGSYSGVRNFLTQLLRIERIVSVDSAVITKEAGSRGENIVVALTLNGNAYYLADTNVLSPLLEENRRKR